MSMETTVMVVGLVEGIATCTDGDGAMHEIEQLVEPVGAYIITLSNCL
jgi:hypothetical protein